GRNGLREEVADHPALRLIARPNAHYGDIALWSGTVLSWCLAGNAYWLKVRNGLGRPAELWYVPHWTMEPKGSDDGSEFLTHYIYRPGGGIAPMRIDPADVVHFRHGIDPRNPRKGIPPLDGVIREIFMDLESSNFVASLLRNMGVPGMVLSPKSGGHVSDDDVKATKAWIREAFGGDRRGEPLVMGAPTDVAQFGFNPQQMNMSEARDIAEERVCASLGIPAAVVGFGAGLQSTKVGATMTELIKLAWRNGVLPVGRAFADELDRSLVPDFGRADGLKAGWDTSEVLALSDDEDKLTTRVMSQVAGGLITLAEGRDALGWDVDPSHQIYLRPAMALETPAGSATAARSSAALPAPQPKSGQKARATPAQRRAGAAYVRALQQQEEPLQKAMEQRLVPYFSGLGREAAAAARPLLAAEDLTPKDAPAGETKSSDLVVAQILDALGIAAHRTALQTLYEAHYLDVAQAVSDAAGLIGLTATLPDPVARSIVGAGGRRAGLIDLEAQTRKALFEALADGRAAGEGAEALAARISEYVEGGPWTAPGIRARTIARTETKYAQNISTLERAKAAGVQRFVVFDGRLGPGRSLDEHIARDGSIVTADEAAQMASDEHPNGTLSFAPHFGEGED
ncbi:phage portal protein, partial [Stappia sp. TSB10P1A]|uniref:phage portal protein n=1 Tax=Stappia sp. TSB10P1A TaxID=2003585 RepID=UPI001643A22F